ncbi:hypothetical protein [Hydrogenophaga sp. BPS33]|uniref:hypothetical protein n=1 Tax=Hydrogenophaga sp. BPS33 TaxID=2651974 RepID=UPI00135CB937|nr:hypothetical protein [Hydrogenophaga sp. BPS33]
MFKVEWASLSSESESASVSEKDEKDEKLSSPDGSTCGGRWICSKVSEASGSASLTEASESLTKDSLSSESLSVEIGEETCDVRAGTRGVGVEVRRVTVSPGQMPVKELPVVQLE